MLSSGRGRSLISSVGKNNEMGKGNDLLWKFPADMKFFRETTSGHPIIMGRKTFESLPNGPLPKRRNIIITRDTAYQVKGAEVAHSLEEAIKLVKDEGEVFVIGGAEIFRQSMDKANRLYITHFDAEDKDADVFFPEIIPIVWNEVSRTEHKPDAENPIPFHISIYEKFI